MVIKMLRFKTKFKFKNKDVKAYSVLNRHKHTIGTMTVIRDRKNPYRYIFTIDPALFAEDNKYAFESKRKLFKFIYEKYNLIPIKGKFKDGERSKDKSSKKS